MEYRGRVGDEIRGGSGFRWGDPGLLVGEEVLVVGSGPLVGRGLKGRGFL